MGTIHISEALEKGQTYMVKMKGFQRASRMEYIGLKTLGELDEQLMEFYGSMGCRFLYDHHIDDIKLAKPLRPKQKKGVTCTRCLGNKVYEKFAHINGGKCFKCGGEGTI
ncbi:hypothetical protein M3_0090 [Lysinibacillus phage vB_LfM_LysYB1]|nr:hypothetical protein M3_0090 [Lysinibacillus phage vB_LfM_LysYB1]WAB25401.1 hypothetical protein M5_0223 [Lysinibacillus phage vB_LfM_LysYB2]